MPNDITGTIVTPLAAATLEEEFVRELRYSNELTRHADNERDPLRAQVFATMSLAAAQRATAIVATWENTVLH